MQYIHVVNGDMAGNTLRQALAQAARPDPVVVLRDDLAVGPIADVDSSGLIRSGFWQRVAPHSEIDFAAEMRQALDQLQGLRQSEPEVAIWHGQSASDQLMLRRVVFHLYQSPQRINEVAMDSRELDGTTQGNLTAIGMYPAARLARRFSTRSRRHRDGATLRARAHARPPSPSDAWLKWPLPDTGRRTGCGTDARAAGPHTAPVLAAGHARCC
ncbi:DUF1835 domain-containing protein [Cupriavidus gilardii]|uniref:DUF1835 domain-containing protein n=1 Tax=Cupriavidus gilardii TaxID=82541 RepID=A0ABY4VSS2_9BURK|nr:DUF1835 domain-containing protein [Cupriavidus gilardii]USE80350.1 DUF1835 domain-containing protein [Cupriavidus gilardii]